MSSDTEPTSGIFVNNQSTLNVKGNLSGTNTYLSTENSKVNVNKDLKLDGKTETIFGSFNGSDIKVSGNASVSDLVRFTADRDSSIEIGKDLNLNSTLSDASNSLRESVGIYNNSYMTVGGDVNVFGDSLIKSDGDASIEIGGDLNVKVDSHRNEIVGIYNNGSIKVNGNLTADRDNEYVETSDINLGTNAKLDVTGNAEFKGNTHLAIWDNSELNVGKNATFNEGEFYVAENSNAKIDGDLTLNHVADTNIWNQASEGSSITVGGDLTLSGLYKEGTGDFSTSAGADEYHRNRLFASGEGSSITVKGNTTVSNNAEIFAETYSNPIDNPDHDKYIDKSTFADLGRATFEGDVNLSTNAKLGAYNAGEVTVDGNVNAQTGGNVQAWDSDSTLTIKGDAKFTDSDSRIQAGRTASIAILGNTSLKDGSIELYDKGSLNIAKNLTSYNGEIVATKNSKLNVGGDLNFSQDKDENVWNKIEDGSSVTVGGNLNVSGLYKEGTGDFSTQAGADEYLRNRFFASGEGSSINVKGNTTVSNNAELFAETYSNPIDNPDYDKYIDKSTFADLGRATFEGDVNLSTNARLGSYNAGVVTVEGNVNAESGGNLQAWGSDATLTVKGDAKFTDSDSRIQAGRTASITILGNTSLQDGSIELYNKGSLSVGGNASITGAGSIIANGNSTLNVGKDLTINESMLEINDNSTATIGGDLNLTHVEDTNIWSQVKGNSSLTVNGDLNMKGHYMPGYYTEDNDIKFFRNDFIINGENGGASTALIKGDVNLTDNSHFMTQTYGHSQTDHTTYHPRDDFEKLSSTTIEGNVTVDRNSKLGAYSASDTFIEGNVTATNGGTITAWNSDAYLGIQGDVSVTDKNSGISAGSTANIDIGGKLTAKNGADVYIGEESTLSVAKKFLVDNATLEVHGGQLLLSGEDSVLDLTNNGVLKTDEAGSINLSKGASVESLKETLLSADTKTTAAGVAQKNL